MNLSYLGKILGRLISSLSFVSRKKELFTKFAGHQSINLKLIPPLKAVGFRGHGAWGMGHGKEYQCPLALSVAEGMPNAQCPKSACDGSSHPLKEWAFPPTYRNFPTLRNRQKAKIRKPILWLVLFASLLLTGCVQYDVGVNFDHSNHGEIVQHIKLGERLTSFSGDYVYEWLNSIERRARKLEGKTRRISPEEIIVSIPFTNGQELQEKFNNFFNSHINQKPESVQNESDSELPKIESNLLIEQNNFLLLVKNRLIYDLDLRSLSLIASNGNVLANTGSILDLDFSLKTPFGAKNIPIAENAIEPEINKNQLLWKLRTGELNHIEVVFWLPSPLGIGALLIGLFVWGGIYLRYTFMPDPRLQFAPKAAVAESVAAE